MSSRFRPKEKWMKKGTRVTVAGRNGAITHVTETNTDAGTMAMTIFVLGDGLPQAYSHNPWDVDKEKTTNTTTKSHVKPKSKVKPAARTSVQPKAPGNKKAKQADPKKRSATIRPVRHTNRK